MFLMTFSPGELTKKPGLRKKVAQKPPMSIEKVQRRVIDHYSGRKGQMKRNEAPSPKGETVDEATGILFGDIESTAEVNENVADLLGKMIEAEKEKEALLQELSQAREETTLLRAANAAEEQKVAERDHVVEVFQLQVAALTEEITAKAVPLPSQEQGTQMEPNDEVGDALRLQEKQLKEEHAAALKIATDECDMLRESIEQMKSEAAKLQGMGQSLEEELANTKHSMAHQSATVQQLEDSVSAAKSQILEQENAAAETIAEKESLVEDLRNQLARTETTTNEQLLQSQKNESALAAEVGELKAIVEQMKEALSTAESDAASTKEELAAKTLAQKGVLAERDESAQHIAELSQAVVEKEGAIDELSKKLELASSSSEEQLRASEEREQELQAEYAETLATIAEKDAEIEDLNERLGLANSASEEIARASEEREQELQAECTENLATIEDLSSKLALTETTTNEQLLQSQKNESALVAEVGELKALVEQVKEALSTAESDAVSTKEQLAAATLAQETASTERQQAVAQMQEAQTEAREATSLRKTAEIKEKALEEEIAGLQQQLRSANDEIKAVQARSAAKLAAVISDSNSKLQRAKEDLAQFRGSVSEQMRNYQRMSDEFEALHKIRRQLHNEVVELRGNNRVFCRIRPGNDGADVALAAQETRDCIDVNEIVQRLNREEVRLTNYQFDRVFGPSVTQSNLFAEVAPLIQSAFDGYPVCIFAYGQTGSGKTHTMLGDPEPENRGIMYRACEQLFASIESCEKAGWKYSVNIQIVEVYNEKLRDLLNHATDSAQELELAARTDPTTGAVYVENLSTHSVSAAEDAVAMLQQALSSRCTKATNANPTSSRSHCIFTIKFRGERASTLDVSEGMMHFCDLAGSERLATSGSAEEPALLREAQNINKSLACLGNTISALVRGDSHVPYRDSRLTYLLSGSLGGNGKCLMMCNLGAERSHLQESLSSLRFAQKVSKVKKEQPCKACSARAKTAAKCMIAEQKGAAEEKK
jgi:kinesin family protein C1